MDSPPPPTRDFRGPFAFVALLAAVAAIAIGLLIYAVSMESDTGFDEFELERGTTTASGGGMDRGADASASLRITGTPFGATVFVDSDSVGTLPMLLDGLEPGDHLLTLETQGVALDTLVTVAAGEMGAVYLALAVPRDAPAPPDTEPEPAPEPDPTPDSEPPAATTPTPTTAMLRITSRPSGAAIRLDGVPVGTTPLALPQVQVGRRTVTATLPGHQTSAQDVVVRGGRDQVARFALAVEAGPGQLEVLARPWGTIYIDGALHKRNTDVVYRTDLPAGTHEIRVAHPTFGTQTRQVTVEAGQSQMEVFDLTAGAAGQGEDG